MAKNNEQTHHWIDFIKIAKYSLWVSCILVIIGITLIFIRGFSWGVDFAGGNQIRVTFDKNSTINRDILEKTFLSIHITPSITEINNTDRKEFFIYYSAQNKEQIKDIKNIFEKQFPQEWTIVSESFVGSKVGEQFRKIALISTIVTLILILIYIAFRFDFRFGIAAIISLVHDIILVLCFISFIDMTFTVPILAALLTIVGYSLNDTIVIFDRMRNERKLMDKDFISTTEYYNLVNRSIGKSLTRTFLTGGTTLLVLLVLYFVGGVELKPMALVLTLGVFIGTISSNLVAPPVLYLWHKKDISQAKKS